RTSTAHYTLAGTTAVNEEEGQLSKREDIIAAAIRLAERSEPGQANLSVRAVAAEAGVGASTLRHYFPTQSELHEAVALRSIDTVISDLSITDSSIDPGQRLFQCCAQFLPTHERRELQLELWFSMHLHALGPEKAAVSRRPLEHGHRVTYDCLHRWLNTLAAEGHLDSSETAPAATRDLRMATATRDLRMATAARLSWESMSEASVQWCQYSGTSICGFSPISTRPASSARPSVPATAAVCHGSGHSENWSRSDTKSAIRYPNATTSLKTALREVPPRRHGPVPGGHVQEATPRRRFSLRAYSCRLGCSCVSVTTRLRLQTMTVATRLISSISSRTTAACAAMNMSPPAMSVRSPLTACVIGRNGEMIWKIPG